MSTRITRESGEFFRASAKDWMSAMAFIICRILYTSITNAAVGVLGLSNMARFGGLQAGKGGATDRLLPIPARRKTGSFPVKNFPNP